MLSQTYPLTSKDVTKFLSRRKDGAVPVYTTVVSVDNAVFPVGRIIVTTRVGKFEIKRSCVHANRLIRGVSALLYVTPKSIFETKAFRLQVYMFQKPLPEIKEIVFPEDAKVLYDCLNT